MGGTLVAADFDAVAVVDLAAVTAGVEIVETVVDVADVVAESNTNRQAETGALFEAAVTGALVEAVATVPEAAGVEIAVVAATVVVVVAAGAAATAVVVVDNRGEPGPRL